MTATLALNSASRPVASGFDASPLSTWIRNRYLSFRAARQQSKTVSALRRLDARMLNDIGVNADALNGTPPQVLRIRTAEVALAGSSDTRYFD